MANGWHDGSTVSCVDYLNTALNPKLRRQTISRTVRHLKPIIDTFDAIAVSGVSGMLIGVPVADMLDKPLIVVRKEHNTHSDCLVEGSIEGRYLIVDDLINTGETINTIVASIHNHHNEHAICVGIYLWLSQYYYDHPNPNHLTHTTPCGKIIPIMANAVKRKNCNDAGEFSNWL